MQDVNNIGKQFLSSYGSYELVTLEFLHKELQENKQLNLALSYNATTKVISLRGSSKMSLSHVQNVVDGIGRSVMYGPLMYKPKIENKDENGNWAVKLVFAYQRYFEYSTKGEKEAKKDLYGNYYERLFYKNNLKHHSKEDLERIALKIFSFRAPLANL